MKELILTKGFVAIVDDEDFEVLSQRKWTALITGQHIKRVYAYRRQMCDNGVRKWQKMILLHRAIMLPPDRTDVDHINGDTLDNRRSNLRLATRSQNLANNRRALGATGYRGVTTDKRAKSARYICQCGGKNMGYFDTPEDAARRYDAVASEKFGEFAKLNFPDRGDGVQSQCVDVKNVEK